MMSPVEEIETIDLEGISGGSAWQRCVAGASLATGPSTLFGAALGTAVPGVGTLAGAGIGALAGIAGGCTAGVLARPR